MIIGIMSDSHDNLDRIKQAIDKFNNLAVGYVIHLGDICSPFSVRLFDELKCDYIGVFGNNDGELIGISRLSHGKFHKPPLYLRLGVVSSYYYMREMGLTCLMIRLILCYMDIPTKQKS